MQDLSGATRVQSTRPPSPGDTMGNLPRTLLRKATNILATQQGGSVAKIPGDVSVDTAAIQEEAVRTVAVAVPSAQSPRGITISLDTEQQKQMGSHGLLGAFLDWVQGWFRKDGTAQPQNRPASEPRKSIPLAVAVRSSQEANTNRLIDGQLLEMQDMISHQLKMAAGQLGLGEARAFVYKKSLLLPLGEAIMQYHENGDINALYLVAEEIFSYLNSHGVFGLNNISLYKGDPDFLFYYKLRDLRNNLLGLSTYSEDSVKQQLERNALTFSRRLWLLITQLQNEYNPSNIHLLDLTNEQWGRVTAILEKAEDSLSQYMTGKIDADMLAATSRKISQSIRAISDYTFDVEFGVTSGSRDANAILLSFSGLFEDLYYKMQELIRYRPRPP